MLKFYYSGAPNPTKVALFLEEAGIPYEAIPVDTRKGEQHNPEFLKVNPNAKVPVIVDGDVTVFDSNAILLYLAEKTGKFLPEKSAKLRGELLGINGEVVSVEDRKAGRIEVPLGNIHSAKLVLTDKLIAATKPLDTSGAEENEETLEEEKADD